MNKGKVKKIIIAAVALVLVAALVTCGALLIKSNNELSKYSKKASKYQSALQSEQSENSRLAEENSKLIEDNSSLKNEIAQLAEKKRIETAKAAEQKSKQSSAAVAIPAWRGGEVCYLTFDDGPSDNTLRNLDTLARYGAKATFFVVGTGKLDYVKNIVGAGHAVGLHAGNHNYQAIYSSVDAYFNDLNGLSQRVEGLTGKKPDILRFPGGSSNTVSANYCKGIMTTLASLVRERGYQYFDWNISSGDASGNNVPAKQLVTNVLNGASGKKSICVLMHDTAAKSTTCEALPQIIEGLATMGFRFETLDSTCNGFHHGINN